MARSSGCAVRGRGHVSDDARARLRPGLRPARQIWCSRNGKIVTVDERFTIAQAVAVKGDRIVAVGSSQEIARLAGPNTRTIDLRGRTAIPGLIDNHLHLLRAGNTWELELRWDGVDSRKQAIEMLRARAKSVGPGGWVFNIGGWATAQFTDDRKPFTREELDAIAPGQSSRAAGVLLSSLPEQPGAEGVRHRSRQARSAGLRQRIDPARRSRQATGHHPGRHRRHAPGRRTDAEAARRSGSRRAPGDWCRT